MKTLITTLAMTALIAGATSAKAWDQQATDDQMAYSLSKQAAGNFGAAYASATAPARIHAPRVKVPSQEDFQLQGR